jgi:hypothetical protein
LRIRELQATRLIPSTFPEALQKTLDHYGLIIVMLVAVVFSVLSFAPRLTGTDDAMYLLTAKALAGGEGYSKINLAGHPPEIYHPPMVSVALAPVMIVFPNWPDYIKPSAIIEVLFMLLSIAATWKLCRELNASVEQIFAITLVMATSYVGIGWYTTSVILSEPIFTFFTILSLTLLSIFTRNRNYVILGVAGVCIGMGYLTRTVGITLAAAGVAYFLWKRDYKPALFLSLCVALFVVPWTLRGIVIQGSELGREYRNVFLASYGDTFTLKNWQSLTLGQAAPADYVARLFTNINGHATQTILQLLFPTLTGEHLLSILRTGGAGLLPNILGYATVGSVALGWLACVRRGWCVLEGYVFLYGAVILLPSWYTVRNLVPLLPFLVYYALIGIQVLVQRLFAVWDANRLPQLAAGLLAAAILGSNLLSDRHAISSGIAFIASGSPYAESMPSFLEACEWIKHNTAPNDLVSFKFSDKVYLCSGRQTPSELSTMPLLFGFRGPEAVFQSMINHANWVIIDTSEKVTPLTLGEPADSEAVPEVNEMIEQDAVHFHSIYATTTQPTLRIYQILR